MNKNIIKILLPIVAVVVIVESVVLVSSLDNKTSQSNLVSDTEEINSAEEMSQPVADFVFETDVKEMQVGKDYKVSLNLVGKETANLDAIETYVKYDPEMLFVSELTFGDGLPVITDKSKIDYMKKGVVNLIAFWEGDGEFYSISPDETNVVMSFIVSPKVEGVTEISLVNDDEIDGYSTLLVENGTSNQLSFLSNKLEINMVN
jgi:hypothetical protein